MRVTPIFHVDGMERGHSILAVYLLVLLFLIVSGVSLHLVAHDYENRSDWFRILVLVLYGMSGILALLLFLPNE